MGCVDGGVACGMWMSGVGCRVQDAGCGVRDVSHVIVRYKQFRNAATTAIAACRPSLLRTVILRFLLRGQH